MSLQQLMEDQKQLEVLALIHQGPDIAFIKTLAGRVPSAFAELVAVEAKEVRRHAVVAAICEALEENGTLTQEFQLRLQA